MSTSIQEGYFGNVIGYRLQVKCNKKLFNIYDTVFEIKYLQSYDRKHWHL